MVNSRDKGASFEREVRKRLELELGLGFSRVLAQTREPELPDLVCDDLSFPFVIECKRYRTGSTFASPGHWRQACVSAAKAGRLPALVYKFNRLPERWRIPFEPMLMLATGQRDSSYAWDLAVEMTFEDFCLVARELLSD